MPAAKLSPTSPSITTFPPVMYSHPFESQPSITAVAPEFLTANLSPACPDANKYPDVAPYNTVFPIIVFSLDKRLLSSCSFTTTVAPERPLAT